jgi:hypothetical protein
MWAWFFIGYAVFVAVMAGYAGHVAISCPDRKRRQDAYRVLRLLWAAGTVGSGLIWWLIKLHEAGLV